MILIVLQIIYLHRWVFDFQSDNPFHVRLRFFLLTLKPVQMHTLHAPRKWEEEEENSHWNVNNSNMSLHFFLYFSVQNLHKQSAQHYCALFWWNEKEKNNLRRIKCWVNLKIEYFFAHICLRQFSVCVCVQHLNWRLHEFLYVPQFLKKTNRFTYRFRWIKFHMKSLLLQIFYCDQHFCFEWGGIKTGNTKTKCIIKVFFLVSILNRCKIAFTAIHDFVSVLP